MPDFRAAQSANGLSLAGHWCTSATASFAKSGFHCSSRKGPAGTPARTAATDRRGRVLRCAAKVADLRDAVSYLIGLPSVDPERVAVVGVRPGGFHSV